MFDGSSRQRYFTSVSLAAQEKTALERGGQVLWIRLQNQRFMICFAK